jgi:cytochrome c oxidase subunit IV
VERGYVAHIGGDPLGWQGRAVMALSRELARWIRLLLWAERLIAVLAVLICGFSVAIIVADESAHDDAWDGLGTWVGLVLGGFSLLLIVVAGALLALTAAGRRRAMGGAMELVRWAAGLAALVSLGWLAVAVFLLTDIDDAALGFAIVVPGLLVLWPAFMVLSESTSAPAAGSVDERRS